MVSKSRGEISEETGDQRLKVLSLNGEPLRATIYRGVSIVLKATDT